MSMKNGESVTFCTGANALSPGKPSEIVGWPMRKLPLMMHTSSDEGWPLQLAGPELSQLSNTPDSAITDAIRSPRMSHLTANQVQRKGQILRWSGPSRNRPVA